jgi:hypothetical protein
MTTIRDKAEQDEGRCPANKSCGRVITMDDRIRHGPTALSRFIQTPEPDVVLAHRNRRRVIEIAISYNFTRCEHKA